MTSAADPEGPPRASSVTGVGPGLHEDLVTDRLAAALGEMDPHWFADLAGLRDVEAADRLSRHLAAVAARIIDSWPEGQRATDGVALLRAVVERLAELAGPRSGSGSEVGIEAPAQPPQVLHAVLRRQPDGAPAQLERPLTPILDTTLLTNAPGEPALVHELRAEIHSAASIDVVMAFIRRSGIYPLLDPLRRHCADGGRARVLTTTYTNSTEARALDDLVAAGAEVRVSYDTGSTRLHAKAWVFHRSAATTTAYIGSSNLTRTAQVTGLEWNVRVAAARNPDVVAKMAAVFESYWANGDFVAYDADEFARRTAVVAEGATVLLSPVEVELRPFQEALVERLALARSLGRHRNLLVSATGTGKTVMAAVDYARLRPQLRRDRLLFVAHREELLEQARATYRHALRDPAFGELWVRGRRPQRWDHVFASVQSLAASDLSDLDRDRFDVVVVDEFHHAAAPTYRALLDHLEPVELLGMTATPERSDAGDILHFFAGRIAAELRLWDAIAENHLAPFSYFGIHDGTDLTSVPWRRGRGYDPAALTGILTADHAWARRIIDQVGHKVTDPTRMRAIGFCVGIDHARFMAERFNAAGLAAVAVWGESSAEERRSALTDLSAGRLTTVFTVDLFNEGIDVPGVDTLLFLRPTDSATLFLQQLGRGLRRHAGKSTCTVLDFVGQHRREFRFDQRFRALLGGSRTDVIRQVEHGFPYLPAGCSVDLDPVAAEIVLASLRNALPTTWRGRVDELRAMGDVDLSAYLAGSGLEPADVYAGGHSWSELRRAAGLPTAPAGPDEVVLLKAVGRLLHIDDPERLVAYRTFLAGDRPPEPGVLDLRSQRLLRMLVASVTRPAPGVSLAGAAERLWAHPQVRAELAELLALLGDRAGHLTQPLARPVDVALQVHARYTRIEILAAIGAGTEVRTPEWREGVRYDEAANVDLLAFTLDKTSGSFSPTTRYRDYAVSPELIHWESQSTTSLASATGQRYVTGASTVILFARLASDDRALWCLGPATYVSHQGERPIAITWRLEHRLPADLYLAFAAAVA